MSDEPTHESTQDDRLWTLLAYVFSPVIPVVILLLEDKRERPFIKAHNAQALIWGLFNLFIVAIPSTFCFGIPSIVIWAIGVYWGIRAYQGDYVTIPLVTDFVKLQGWA